MYHESLEVDLLVSRDLLVHHTDGIDQCWYIDPSIRLSTVIWEQGNQTQLITHPLVVSLGSKHLMGNHKHEAKKLQR